MIGRALKKYMKSKCMMMSLIRNGGQECCKSYEVRNVEEKSGRATPCNRTVQQWQCRNLYLCTIEYIKQQRRKTVGVFLAVLAMFFCAFAQPVLLIKFFYFVLLCKSIEHVSGSGPNATKLRKLGPGQVE